MFSFPDNDNLILQYIFLITSLVIHTLSLQLNTVGYECNLWPKLFSVMDTIMSQSKSQSNLLHTCYTRLYKVELN